MLKTCCILWLTVTLAVTSHQATAQENHQPQISVVHPGVEALTTDILSLTNLTSEEEQEYAEELKLFIEDISIGTDIERPIRVDLLTGEGPLNYLIWLPYTDADEFLDNLDSVGFPTYEEPGQKDLFLIDDEVDEGWLRILPDQRYAVFALTTPDSKDITKRQVLQAGAPDPAFEQLKELNAAVAARLHNAKADQESQQARQSSFGETRQEDLAALKKRPTESTSEFELRKGTASIYYDEIQRIFVEAETVNLWSRLDRENALMEVAFDGVGIPESSLARSIGLFGNVPDAFAAIKPLPNNVLSGRLNHPVDDLRQKNAAVFLDLLTADIYSRIDDSKNLQDSEKTASRGVYDDVITVFRDGFASGNVNGFVEATHDGSAFTLVGAVSAPGSERLTETLKQLPAAREGNTADLGVATAGDITIHRITFAEGFVGLADEIFGVGCEFFVGVGLDQVWLATGPGSAELLTEKIAEVGDAEESDVVLHVDMKLSAWVNRLHELAEEQEMPEAVEDRADYRDNLLRLEQLSESLKGDDQLMLSITSTDARVSGLAKLGKGLLTFVGRQIAKMTKENLEL